MTNQLFIYADNVDMVWDDIDPLHSNNDILVEACNEVDL